MKEDIFIHYKTNEERVAAFKRMVGMRQEWEARVRNIVAQRNNVQVAR